jgi:hypothetical protein
MKMNMKRIINPRAVQRPANKLRQAMARDVLCTARDTAGRAAC